MTGFTEAALEQAIITLLEQQGYPSLSKLAVSSDSWRFRLMDAKRH
jgi:hypothetical protein